MRKVLLAQHFSGIGTYRNISPLLSHWSIYVPILRSLSEILKNVDVQDKLFKSAKHHRPCQYAIFHDGSNFKENKFLSEEELRLSLFLYCDDFEICNLGSLRKKHKITGVYWVLADNPSVLRSALSFIYLADDVKKIGYSAVLEPLA